MEYSHTINFNEANKGIPLEIKDKKSRHLAANMKGRFEAFEAL